MASRSGGNVGLGITITLLGLLLLTTFITTVVFYGQRQKVQTELTAANTALRDFIQESERARDDVQRLRDQAQRERKSLVMFLKDSLEETMRRVTGDAQETAASLAVKLDGDESGGGVEGARAQTLVQVIRSREQTIADLEQRLADEQTARRSAESDLQEAVARVERVQADHAATIAALNDEIGRYKGDADRYRSLVDGVVNQNNSRVDDIRRGSAEREAALQDRIARLEQDNVLLQQTLEQLRAAREGGSVKARGEHSLVDGRVVGRSVADRQAFIDLGRDKRVTLGMTFEVYEDGTQIRADAEGNYPPGKATIEIIRVGETTSVGRVIRERQGQPVIEGDVIANAVYDPDKEYVFIVFGDFDANRDGSATPAERNTVAGIIEAWGGRVEDEISGRTDFVVLGERPVLPPPPSPDAPLPVIQEYIRKQQIVQKYDELFRTATQTGIPVLNENRLYTLTGMYADR